MKDASSEAELALSQARVYYLDLSAIDAHGRDAKMEFTTPHEGTDVKQPRLMGINNEVVATVRRKVGVSVAKDVVQQCATYLQL